MVVGSVADVGADLTRRVGRMKAQKAQEKAKLQPFLHLLRLVTALP